MRDYELTYIIKPDLDATTVTSLIERISGFITAEGGIVAKTNHWGLRQLAYPIRKFRDGNYVFSIVQIEAPSLTRIEQRLRLLEDVLRYLLVRAEDAVGDSSEEAADVMGGETAVEAAPAAEAAEASTEPSTEASADTPATSEPTPATA